MDKHIFLVTLLFGGWILSGCQQRAADSNATSKQEIKWIDEEDLKKIGKTPEQGVIFMPTPPMVVNKMLEMAHVKQSDLLYDLGCGDGRIVIAAAKKYGCRAVGFEIDKEIADKARENVRKNKVGHLVRIEQKDIFTVDLSPADVVTLYLTPDLNVRLIPQLETLKPGSRIVSHDFDMKGVKPDKVIDFTSKEPDFVNIHKIYLWTTPLKRE